MISLMNLKRTRTLLRRSIGKDSEEIRLVSILLLLLLLFGLVGFHVILVVVIVWFGLVGFDVIIVVVCFLKSWCLTML